MEAYLEGNEPDVATLKRLIRKGTLDQAFVPVCCGSAFKNKGVQPLLDAVVDYLPSAARHRRRSRASSPTATRRTAARPTTTRRSPRWRSRS